MKINYLKLKKNMLFFKKNDEFCYSLKKHLIDMAEDGIKEMDLWIAKREINSNFFFCKYYQEVGEKTETPCGKICQGYQPRNGKSGVCRHFGSTYTRTNKVKVKVKIILE